MAHATCHLACRWYTPVQAIRPSAAAGASTHGPGLRRNAAWPGPRAPPPRRPPAHPHRHHRHRSQRPHPEDHHRSDVGSHLPPDHDFYIDTIAAPVLVHNCPVSPSAGEGSATVSDVLKGKLGSIMRAPLPSGSPAWSDIMDMSMDEIRAAARANQPGFKTILKAANGQ